MFREDVGAIVFLYQLGVVSVAENLVVVGNISLSDSPSALLDYCCPQAQLIFDSSFQPMEQRSFAVSVLDDSIIEPTETIQVRFTSTEQVEFAEENISISLTDDDGELIFS